jgi:hypothetical protein
VLSEELQQLELLVREVERTALQLGRVGIGIDRELTGADQSAAHGGGVGEPADGQPQPGFGLGRACAGEDDVVDTPVGVERDQPGFGYYRDEGNAQPGRVQHPAGGAGLGQLGPGIDDHNVGAGPGEQGADVPGCGPHGMRKQVERG